jgi:hypothetical protein
VQVIMVIFSWSAKQNTKKKEKKKKESDLASSPTITNILTRTPHLTLIFFSGRVTCYPK